MLPAFRAHHILHKVRQERAWNSSNFSNHVFKHSSTETLFHTFQFPVKCSESFQSLCAQGHQMTSWVRVSSCLVHIIHKLWPCLLLYCLTFQVRALFLKNNHRGIWVSSTKTSIFKSLSTTSWPLRRSMSLYPKRAVYTFKVLFLTLPMNPLFPHPDASSLKHVERSSQWSVLEGFCWASYRTICHSECKSPKHWDDWFG